MNEINQCQTTAVALRHGMALSAGRRGARLSRCALAATVSLLPLTVPAVTAQAQVAGAVTGGATAAKGPEEVIVTSQRRSQRLQDVPANITAVTSRELAQRHITSTAQALRSVPSVTVVQPYGDGGPPNITIRGISSTDFSMNQSKPIAIYIDEGIRDFQLFEIMPLYDIERVEVLNGPQGTLYGKNASGGAVNIITKKPGFDTEGYVTAGYGNFNRATTQGAFQTPLIKDVLTARIAYDYAHDDGINKNLTPGVGNLDQTDFEAIRASLLWKITPDLQATLRYNHFASFGRDNAPLPTDLDFSIFPSLATIPGVYRQGVSFFANQTLSAPTRDIREDGMNLQVEWTGSPFYKLTSITTGDWGHWYDRITGGLPINNDYAASTTPAASQFVQELRVASTFKGPLSIQGGLFGSTDHVENQNQYLINYDTRCGSACYYGLGIPGIGFNETNRFSQDRQSVAGYARVDYKVLPNVHLIGGVRQSYDQNRIYDYSAAIGTAQNPAGIPSFNDLNKTAYYTNTSWEAGGNWKPVSNVLTYFTFKEGYRTGAFNGQAILAPSELTSAPPETTQAYELGVKTSWLNRRVYLNADIFETDYHHQQIIVPDNNNGTFSYPLESIPAARIRGVEAELTVRPVPRVTLSGNVSLIDPEYTQGDINGVSLVGNQMTNASRFNATINGDFTLYKDERRSLGLNLNGTYLGRQYFDVYNTAELSQAGYFVGNGRLSFEQGRYTVSAFVKNITNRKYIIYNLLENSSIGENYALRGDPRIWGGELTVRF